MLRNAENIFTNAVKEYRDPGTDSLTEAGRNKTHRIPTFNSIFQVCERQRVKEAVVDEKTKFDKEIKERMRKKALNSNPRVTGFTDICTRIRLAAFSLLFSNTFPPFNNQDLFFLLHLLQNETIHGLQGSER